METIDAVRDLGWSGKDAKAFAIEALRFLAGAPETMSWFLDQTGIDIGERRKFATVPSLHVGAIDVIVCKVTIMPKNSGPEINTQAN